MIQIIPSHRTGADDLAEIINAIRHTVVAARPDAQVDRHAIAPEDCVRVYVGRACVADNILGVIHRCGRGEEKSGRDG